MHFSKPFIYSFLVASVVAGCGVSPKPMSVEEVAEFALTDFNKIYKSQESLPKVLTLSDAMARALKYNLDNRVKLMEQTLASKSIDMAEHDMWPMLGVSAGYLDRSNIDASQSRNIYTNQLNFTHSTSQQRARANADIRFTWNILDFGVSYLQARQNAEKYLISQKTREKVMLKLLQQVRSAYWRALVMQKMSKDVDVILKKVDVALADLKAVREKQLYTPLFALNDIRALVETKKQLEDMKESIIIANVELTTLINVPSSTVLILEAPEKFDTVIPKIPGNINEMELTALLNSSDYTSEIHNVHIEQMETHKALLRLLPGIEFSYGGYYASNSYLFNNLWGEAGVRLAGDLLKLLTVPDTLEYGEISHNLAISRRLAVNTAVVAGVHLAWQNYTNSVNRLEQSKFLTQIDDEIATLTRNAQQNRSGSEVEAIQNEFKAFGSKMSHLLAYTKMQDSFGAFMVSLGSSPVPENYQSLPVTDLAKALGKKYQYWEKGQLDLVKLEEIKKRIAERREREEAKSVVRKIVDDPHTIFPDLSSDTETREQEVQNILQQKTATQPIGYLQPKEPEAKAADIKVTEIKADEKKVIEAGLSSKPVAVSPISVNEVKEPVKLKRTKIHTKTPAKKTAEIKIPEQKVDAKKAVDANAQAKPLTFKADEKTLKPVAVNTNAQAAKTAEVKVDAKAQAKPIVVSVAATLKPETANVDTKLQTAKTVAEAKAAQTKTNVKQLTLASVQPKLITVNVAGKPLKSETINTKAPAVKIAEIGK